MNKIYYSYEYFKSQKEMCIISILIYNDVRTRITVIITTSHLCLDTIRYLYAAFHIDNSTIIERMRFDGTNSQVIFQMPKHQTIG